jgi:thiaminase
MITVTAKELRVLQLIKEDQNEEGHSDFLSTDAQTKSFAGVVSSLFKKGLIYDAYGNWDREDFNGEKPFKMWCMTYEAVNIVGKPVCWD